MASHHNTRQGNSPDDLAELAGAPAVGIVRELWDFLKCRKKWLLLPIFVALLLIAIFAFLLSTPAAVFIYPLF